MAMNFIYLNQDKTEVQVLGKAKQLADSSPIGRLNSSDCICFQSRCVLISIWSYDVLRYYE